MRVQEIIGAEAEERDPVVAEAAGRTDLACGSRDVIFSFAYASWETVRGRGMCFPEDRMAETLMQHPSVRRLIVAETPRSLPIRVVKDVLRPPPPFPTSAKASLYRPARLRRSDPAGIGAVERTFRAWDSRARRAAASRGLERPALITAHPLVAGFAPLEWASSVTFYAWDDFAELQPLRRLWPAYREAYRRIREQGRRVVAVSPAILEKIQPSGPSAVVPNGVIPAEWESPGQAPEWFTALPGPRLLYLGSLESRIDVDAIGAAARALPQTSTVLVGPLQDPAHFEALRREPNVFLRPPVGRAEVVELVAAADVCLIPHVRNGLTEAMSPLKLYEYLAGGAPVAALDLAPIRGVSPRVVIREDLADAIVVAIALGRASDAERRSFAEANSWRVRQDQIIEMALAGT
jgi:teichuronic acid biosynthesis glycosyltransferase TuaH